MALAVTAYQRRMQPYPAGHPLYPASIEESIAQLTALTLAQVRSVHTDLVGGSHGDIAVVGDFDRAAVEAFARDSQQGSSLPRQNLKQDNQNQLTAEHLAEIHQLLAEHHTIHTADFIVPGTIQPT